MIGRRAVLLAGVGHVSALSAASAASALSVPAAGALGFRLIRHGSEIGQHRLSFEQRGEKLSVRIAVTATVSLLSVPIVRYSHLATENWQGGVLIGLTAETLKNGTREWAQAQRGREGLEVSGSKTRPYVAPTTAIATSYWNRRMLDGPMISLEDGVLLRPRITAHAVAPVRAASGSIPAQRFALRGDFDVDVWYDLEDGWAALDFTVADGSDVHYERL